MRLLTDKEWETVKKEHSYYNEKFRKLGEYDSYMEKRTEKELRERQEGYEFCLNMSELKRFQLEHDIQLTPNEEERVKMWFHEGFSFNFNFTVHADGIIPIEEDYGFCILDYLAADSEEFKYEVDLYRALCLSNRHDNPKYHSDQSKDFQMKEMNKYLKEYPDSFCKSEINGCRQWLDDGHAFWTNPFGLVDGSGCERNYLSALMHLRQD